MTLAALSASDWLFYFRIGLGTIAFYITGELLPQRYRSTGQSVVFTLALLLNWGFMFVTLPAYTQYDVWSFIPLFVLPGAFCLYYLWRYMPETANREIYDIVDELKRRYGKKNVVKVAPVEVDHNEKGEKWVDEWSEIQLNK